MDDFKEQEPGDEQEIQLEDLGAPEKGFGFILFSLGEKWRAAVHVRSTSVALIWALCLIALFLLPGSTPMRPVAHAPRSALFTSEQGKTCVALSIDATVIARSFSGPTPPGGSVYTGYACSTVQQVGGKP